ncbi:ATP-binding protein [Streptomyces sp. NBC_01455]|uniref:ATP-binding protein n=1 Tax=Streptomyces sp. NBC_01455 TaxID=2903874 RepID=UPI002E377807|nr:helix-turn-helix domain-containing protein [Streptomyces sp. NBC_01455]
MGVDGASGPDEFGQLLVALRRGAGLSQEQLAHLAGISVRALADMERGRTRGPQRGTVQALCEALRVEPSAAGELERAAAAGRPRGERTGGGPARHPLALPRDLHDFTARRRSLDGLRSLVAAAEAADPPVVVVCGQPGLGKTAFAVHAAHSLAPFFPDGQFALDLHGLDMEPADPREALARLLRALGVADRGIPPGTEDRSGLLRSILAERRVLLLLDNAGNEAQVRPLLPATGHSLTIVTSRNALAGLEAVHRTELSVLRREEAVELLTRIVGPERVSAEAQAARDLADLCGNLPLAVRIVGQRLAARPGERLRKLVGLLAQEERRLDALQAGGLQVRAAFALSYRRLGPSARTVFRRASLAADKDFGPATAALLAGLSSAEAARCAEELTDAGLLQPHPSEERYRFHDLLRLFAEERAVTEDGPETCAAARDLTARWMLRRATAAALRFDADRHQDTHDGDPDPATAPADRDQARTWLETERDEWLSALKLAHATGHHQEVVDAAEAMRWFSDLNQHWGLWAEVFTSAVESSRALGSRHDEAVHLNYLAWAHNNCRYDHTAALQTAELALTAAREIADTLKTGWALGYAAGALQRLGRIDEAIGRLREAAACLEGQTSANGRLAELTVLNTLGNNLRDVGRAEEALAVHRRSEAICRTGMPGQSTDLVAAYHAVALAETGRDLAALRRWAEAEEPLRRAVTKFERARMAAWSEPARLDLGRVLRHLNHLDEARDFLRAADDALGGLNSPRQAEASAELVELDRMRTTQGR